MPEQKNLKVEETYRIERGREAWPTMRDASTGRQEIRRAKEAPLPSQAPSATVGGVTPPVPVENLVRERYEGRKATKLRAKRKTPSDASVIGFRTKAILAAPIVVLMVVIAMSLTVMPRNRPAAAANVATVPAKWTAMVRDAWKWRGSSTAPAVLVVDVAVSPDADADDLTVADVSGSIMATQDGAALDAVSIGSDSLPTSVAGTQDPNARIDDGSIPDSNFSRDSRTVRVAFVLRNSVNDVRLEAHVPQADGGAGETLEAFHGDDALVRTGSLAIRGTLADGTD